MNQLRQFKKKNKKISSRPILFWPPTLELKDLGQIIKVNEIFNFIKITNNELLFKDFIFIRFQLD